MAWFRISFAYFAMGRFRRNFLLKIIAVLCTVSLLWLQVIFFIYQGWNADSRERSAFNKTITENITTTFINNSTGLARTTNLTAVELQQLFQQENEAQVLLNSHNITWPPERRYNNTIFWPDGIVLAIQVHNRISYLEKLIESLSRARHIERAFLVFSHDFYSEELNEVVRGIRFAPVLQLFFPYAIQLYPSTFPGDSPLDCPRDTRKENALAMGCANAEWPDLYGHYREARFSQTKHHWWWKANFIFSRVRVMRNYHGPVVFLEEDHYVADDFLHVLWLQQQLLKGTQDCPACADVRILSLGSYPKSFSYQTEGPKVDLMPWSSSKHNMGMAFNRSTWTELLSCAQMFCSVDDYNWDWSLLHVAQKCLPAKHSIQEKFIFSTLVLKAPRVFHIGECGVHHRKRTCAADSSLALKRAEQALRTAHRRGYLYPENLTVKNLLGAKIPKLKKGNGGWGDQRDQQLCMAMTEM